MADSVGDFLGQKLANFCAFARSLLAKQPHPKFEEYIGKVEKLDVTAFIALIVTDLKTYAGKERNFITKMLVDNDASSIHLSDEDMNKLCRYCECFIAVCS